MDHGQPGVDLRGPPHRAAHPAAIPIALPVHRRIGSGLLQIGHVRGIGHRGSIEQEGGQLDPVPGPLVVIREPNVGRADLVRSPSTSTISGPSSTGSAAGSRSISHRLIGLDHLQELEHGLVVLILVGEQHLVDEPVRQQPVLGVELDLAQHLEGALADLVHVRADLIGTKDGQLASDLAGLLDRVVELAEVSAQWLASADTPDQPELLEVPDVAEVPDQRAQDRVVDPIELLVGERLDQLEGVAACLLQAPGQLGLAVGGGTTPTLSGGCNLRDAVKPTGTLLPAGKDCNLDGRALRSIGTTRHGIQGGDVIGDGPARSLLVAFLGARTDRPEPPTQPRDRPARRHGQEVQEEAPRQEAPLQTRRVPAAREASRSLPRARTSECRNPAGRRGRFTVTNIGGTSSGVPIPALMRGEHRQLHRSPQTAASPALGRSLSCPIDVTRGPAGAGLVSAMLQRDRESRRNRLRNDDRPDIEA